MKVRGPAVEGLGSHGMFRLTALVERVMEIEMI